jgi:hypothetical protein
MRSVGGDPRRIGLGARLFMLEDWYGSGEGNDFSAGQKSLPRKTRDLAA